MIFVIQRHACNEQQRQPLEMSADDASVILADDGLHIGNYLLQLENNVELDDEWIAKARDIVFETPEVKEKAIEELKLMICGKLIFNPLFFNNKIILNIFLNF